MIDESVELLPMVRATVIFLGVMIALLFLATTSPVAADSSLTPTTDAGLLANRASEWDDEEEEEDDGDWEEEPGEEDEEEYEEEEEEEEGEDFEEEEEEDEEEEEGDYDDWQEDRESRNKASKKGGKRRKVYESEIDITAVRPFKNDNGRFALTLGTQYNIYSARSRFLGFLPTFFGLASNTNRQVKQQNTPPLNQAIQSPYAGDAGVQYQAWPSMTAGLGAEVYPLQGGVHALGLELSYLYSFYRLTITLKKEKIIPTTAMTHNTSANLVYRVYPFRDLKSLCLMPKAGFRMFMFDGNDIESMPGAPLFFFLDAVYMGANLAPVNLIWYLPAGDDNFDLGIKAGWEILFQPTYEESKQLYQATNQRSYITGNPTAVKTNMLNHFITAGATMRFDRSWGLDFLFGLYTLDVFFDKAQSTTGIVDNRGVRGGFRKEIVNAVIQDRYYNFLATMYFLF